MDNKIVIGIEEGVKVELDRLELEAQILSSIFDKFEEAREKEPGMYNMIKQAVNMLKTFGGIRIDIPKGENALEYMVMHFLGLGLDTLENSQTPLAVKGVVSKEPAAETEETKEVEVI